MSGETAKYTPFSETNNICVVMEPEEGLETHDYEQAGRMLGLKVATFIGEAARNMNQMKLLPMRQNLYLIR